MKCPQCGFVSFEFLAECKGCGNELQSHKSEYEIEMDQPGMLPILTYYNRLNESKKSKVEEDIRQLHEDSEDIEETEGAASPFEEEAVTLEDLTGEETEDVDLSATELPDLDAIQLDESIEDIDLTVPKEEPELVELQFEESPKKEPVVELEEISLDLGEEPVAAKVEEVSLDLGTEPEEEISLDLGLDLEEKEPVRLETEEVSLEELEAPAKKEIQPVELESIEEAEELNLSFGEEEVISLDDLMGGSQVDEEPEFEVEEEETLSIEAEEPKKAEPAKQQEAAPAQFDTGGLELSLESDDDVARREEEIKTRAKEKKSFDDLDIDLKLELE